MGSYRRRPGDGQHRLLLPLSFGLSSTVLLHVLNAHLERQQKAFAGPAYELHVLVVEPSSISPSNSPSDQTFDLVQKSFSMHSYSRVPFHSVLEYDPDIHEIISKFAGPSFADDASLSQRERLDAFRTSIPTPSSKADVDYILMNRLAVAYAKRTECTGILWGDSDSRLAAKTLANVAKGRGSSMPWQVSDGMSPWGLKFNFPLRELFSVELQNYADLYPELCDIIMPGGQLSENVPTKSLSIDELMMRYVRNHGEKYPGVMANVTRTASKLQPSSVSPNMPLCALCGAVAGNSGGSRNGHTLGNDLPQFCYACIRSRPDVH